MRKKLMELFSLINLKKTQNSLVIIDPPKKQKIFALYFNI